MVVVISHAGSLYVFIENIFINICIARGAKVEILFRIGGKLGQLLSSYRSYRCGWGSLLDNRPLEIKQQKKVEYGAFSQ